jgi:hypothetical protein
VTLLAEIVLIVLAGVAPASVRDAFAGSRGRRARVGLWLPSYRDRSNWSRSSDS